MRVENRNIVVFMITSVILLMLAPLVGAERLSFSNQIDHRIFFELRVPRVLFLCFAGGALAILGGTYQILFHNPLAEPYLLGVSSAVTLGIVVSEVVLKLHPYSLPWIASGIVAALAATALLVAIYLSNSSSDRIVLFGMGLTFVLSSSVFLLLSYSYQQMGGGSMRWIFGQVPWLSTRELCWFVLLSLPLLAGEFTLCRSLDALSLGDGISHTLGFSPKRARVYLLCLTSIHVALIVTFSGSIGFVGLVVPHAVRLIFHPPTTRLLSFLSFALGAVFLTFSDIASRMILPPFEFPIGIITTLIGGPLFLFLLWKNRT
jgi:iron complex transport system permease protein